MKYPFTEETRNKFGIRITSDYGWRKHPITGATSFHTGIDFAPTKTGDIPIIATIDGVCENLVDKNGGMYCFIQSSSGECAMTVHHKKFLKPHRSQVKVGDEIAYMGSSGNSTGVHVHYECRHSRSSATHFDPKPLSYYNKQMSSYDIELQGAKDWMELVNEKFGISIQKKWGTDPVSRDDFGIMLKRYNEYLHETNYDDMSMEDIVSEITKQLPQEGEVDTDDLVKKVLMKIDPKVLAKAISKYLPETSPEDVLKKIGEKLIS